MTTFPTNLILRLSQTDPGFTGSPQDYAEHVTERLEIRALTQIYGLAIVTALPVANEGPVLWNGKLYVWDEDQAKYVPTDITDSLLLDLPDTTNKFILVCDAGTWGWKKSTDFWTWAGLSAANIAPGAAGTIMYSDGLTNAFGAPSVALPAKSVAITKLVCDAADSGKFSQAQSDGSVTWVSVVSARQQYTESAEYSIPGYGSGQPITRPAGAVAVRAFMRFKSGNAFADDTNKGWTIGEEVELWGVDCDTGSAGARPGFNLITKAGEWIVQRTPVDGTGGTSILPRDVAGESKVIKDASWKLVIGYL